jgi:ABC-type antimicrobial peptide transport system permease subunit
LLLSVAGLGIGLAAGLGSAAALDTIFVGAQAMDPVILIAVTLLVLTLGFLASYIPARRAMRIDPVSALRSD